MFSALPKFLLVFFSGLFGIVMIIIAPPTEKAIFFYGFGVFCLAIAFACITKGKLQEFISSSIGLSIFLIGLWYLYTEISSGLIYSGSRSEPSIINAIIFLIVFGFPGISYALSAKFGFKKTT